VKADPDYYYSVKVILLKEKKRKEAPYVQ